MPQGTGYLNTAPNPIPSNFNPAGMNVGVPGSGPGASTGMPVPPIGSIPTSLNPSTQNQLPQSFFPANTGGAPQVPSGLTNLSSGLFSPTSQGGNWYQNLYNELGRAYGKGTGQLLGNMLSKGLFNPEVAQALMNAMEPTISRGYNDVLSAFGAEGARFSSAAAIGAGDYMSQARLGQTAQLANIYQQDQAEQLGILQNVLPTLHSEEANRGGGVLSDILGGLEMAGGIIGAPFTGGASLGLVGAGISTITGQKQGGQGGQSSSPFAGLSSIFQPSSNVGAIPSSTQQTMSQAQNDAILQIIQSQSAGETLGMPNQGSGIPFSY
jgi:hypothetical protein